MSTVISSFDSYDISSNELKIAKGNRFVVQIWGTFVANIRLQSKVPGSSWTLLQTITAPGTVELVPVEKDMFYRLNISDNVADFTSGEAFYSIEEGTRTDTFEGEWDDLRFPAQAVNPTGLTGAAGVDDTQTAFPATLLFDNTTSELCCGVAQMPHGWVAGSPIRPHIHWAKTSSASGGVVWHLYTRRTDAGSAAGSWVGPVVGVDRISNANTAELQVITTFGDVSMTGGIPSSMLGWRLYRMPGETADTYAADARLFEFDIHYLKNSNGSGAEFLR